MIITYTINKVTTFVGLTKKKCRCRMACVALPLTTHSVSEWPLSAGPFDPLTGAWIGLLSQSWTSFFHQAKQNSVDCPEN